MGWRRGARRLCGGRGVGGKERRPRGDAGAADTRARVQETLTRKCRRNFARRIEKIKSVRGCRRTGAGGIFHDGFFLKPTRGPRCGGGRRAGARCLRGRGEGGAARVSRPFLLARRIDARTHRRRRVFAGALHGARTHTGGRAGGRIRVPGGSRALN